MQRVSERTKRRYGARACRGRMWLRTLRLSTAQRSAALATVSILVAAVDGKGIPTVRERALNP